MGSDDDGDDDPALLERWQAGDRAAGSRLVRRHYDGVTRFFDNAVGDDRRQDLVQKTFEKLTVAKDDFRLECSVRTYLFVLARRVLLDHLRVEYRKKNQGELDPLTHTVEDVDGVTASRLVAELQRTRKLLTCLRALPVDTKQMLELYYWQGCTAEELGKVFAEGSKRIPAGTIRRRIHDTNAKLRACLGREAPPAAQPADGEEPVDRELEDELRALGQLLAAGPSGL